MFWTYAFFDLALGGLDLLLQFINHFLHSHLTLAILFRLERQLLQVSVRLSNALVRFLVTSLLAVQFHLKFAHALLQLLDHSLSAFECVRFSLVQAQLEFLDL